jgi:hypothetical protein
MLFSISHRASLQTSPPLLTENMIAGSYGGLIYNTYDPVIVL